MNNSSPTEVPFKQHLIDGLHLRSPLHIAFVLAFGLLMSAFIIGFTYVVVARGTMPDILLNHLSEADRMAQRGEFAEAAIAYRRAVEVAPDDLEALLRLHRTAVINEDGDTIWWALERALLLEPRNPRVQMLVADAYLEQGQFELARQHFNSVINLAPETIEASYRLGYIAAELDELSTARRWLEYTLALDPDHLGARQYLISLGEQ